MHVVVVGPDVEDETLRLLKRSTLHAQKRRLERAFGHHVAGRVTGGHRHETLFRSVRLAFVELYFC